MRNRKKKYPSYNELRQIKIQERIESEKILREYYKRQEVRKIKEIGAQCAEVFGVSKEDVYNSMGLYRFEE